MANPPPGKGRITTTLSRDLSLFHITMMGVGMMIGAGVFLGIGNAIGIAGPGGLLLTFTLNGVIALFTAMSYAELSSAVPRAGGAYNFARIAYGRAPSFLAGWMEWFASSVAGSLYAVTFAIYTVHYFFQLGLLGWLPVDIAIFEKIVAVAIAAAFIYTNYRGASQTGSVGALLTLGQILTLVFIAAVGLIVAVKDPTRLANFQPFLPQGWGKLLITMGFTYVAFEGFEVISQTGDEAIDPRRNLPKAMLYSVLVTVLTYVGVSFASVVGVRGVHGPVWAWIGSFGEKGFGEAVARMIPYGGFVVTIAVIFASTSALNATIYSATRVSYALGRDRMLPSIFSRLSNKRLIPSIALLFSAVLVLTVAAFLPTIDLAASASMMFLFLFFLVNLSVIRIRRKMKDELVYGFLMPLFPYLPIAAIVVQAALAAWLIHMSLLAWIVAPGWVVAGIVVYFLYSRSHTTVTEEEVVVVQEQAIPAKHGYRIMLAVANPANAVQLAVQAYRFCQAKKAEAAVVHVIPVPTQLSLEDASTHMLVAEEAITEAMLYLSTDFPFGSSIRYCRNPARGIASAAIEMKADLLIMGWGGFRRSGFVLGSTIDPILERATCDIVVLKNSCGQSYSRVLVPVGGGPNMALTVDVASILVDPEEGRIVLLNIVTPGTAPLDFDELMSSLPPNLSAGKARIEVQRKSSSNVLQTLLKEAEDYDLVVMGASGEGLFQRRLLGSLPEAFAKQYEKTLAMVQAKHRVKSLLRRVL